MKVLERVDKGSKNIDNYNIKNKGGGVTFFSFLLWTLGFKVHTMDYLYILWYNNLFAYFAIS